ncbi:MAG: hypothetical protein GX025_07055 [Clostridiales bacterium]|nr:hypothetical protein [Clostridiales bacterium]
MELAKRNHLSRRRLQPKEILELCFFLVSLCFVLGAILGCLVGTSFPDSAKAAGGLLDFNFLGMGFVSGFLGFAMFSLLAVFLGSSYLGVAFLPLLTGARGYILSCSSASIISSSGDGGLITALIVLGIPAFISLPCFFTVVVDAAISSRRLGEITRGRYAPQKNKLMLHFFLSVPFLVLGTLLEMKLVPYLVSILT